MSLLHSLSTRHLDHLSSEYVKNSCRWLTTYARVLQEKGNGEQFLLEDQTLGIYAIKKHKHDLKIGNTPMSGNFGIIKLTCWRRRGMKPWWTGIDFEIDIKIVEIVY
jgi:hypothetical protein